MGGVVQVENCDNIISSAHVEGAELVQVGDLFLEAHPQVLQEEGLRKVIVNRGVKRKRS